MRTSNDLAPELVREVMGYLQGEELPVALTNTRLLMIARSIHRTICAAEECVREQWGTDYICVES